MIIPEYPLLSVMGKYDVGVVEEMDAEGLDCLTRLTSRDPSADHKSTLRTNVL